MTEASEPVDYFKLMKERELRERKGVIRLPTVRVCDAIQPDATQAAVGLNTFEEQYGAITGELLLLGWNGLKRDAAGTLRMIASLREAAPWLDAATGNIERQLEIALLAGRPWLAFRPLLLVGPPGSGKSHYAALISEAAEVPFVQVPMGGDSDNRSLAGTARGWTGAQPGLAIVAMVQHKTANPLVILDEIEKVSSERRNGNAHEALLAMLEPRTARCWYDRCLMAPVDLRHIVWVATANSLDGIPTPLLSRFDIVRVPAPRPQDAPALIASLRHEVCRSMGLPVEMQPELGAGTTQLLVEHFERTGSIRLLRRGVEIAVSEALKETPRVLQ